jgi:hypothetical protein
MEEDIMHGRDVEPAISARVGDYVSGDREIEQDASEAHVVSSQVGAPIDPKRSGSGSESAVDAVAERPAS